MNIIQSLKKVLITSLSISIGFYTFLEKPYSVDAYTYTNNISSTPTVIAPGINEIIETDFSPVPITAVGRQSWGIDFSIPEGESIFANLTFKTGIFIDNESYFIDAIDKTVLAGESLKESLNSPLLFLTSDVLFGQHKASVIPFLNITIKDLFGNILENKPLFFTPAIHNFTVVGKSHCPIQDGNRLLSFNNYAPFSLEKGNKMYSISTLKSKTYTQALLFVRKV